MTDYVPTTPEVNGIRDGWACTHVRDDITLEQAREAFDRWLASEKAAVWDEGYEVGYEDQRYRDTTKRRPANPYEDES